MWTIVSIFDANDKIQAFSLIVFVYSNKEISTKLSNTTKKQTTTIHNSNGVSCLWASLSPTVTKSILSDALHYTGCHIIIDQIIWFDWIWIKWNTYYMLKRSVINLWHGMAWHGMNRFVYWVFWVHMKFKAKTIQIKHISSVSIKTFVNRFVDIVISKWDAHKWFRSHLKQINACTYTFRPKWASVKELPLKWCSMWIRFWYELRTTKWIHNENLNLVNSTRPLFKAKIQFSVYIFVHPVSDFQLK